MLYLIVSHQITQIMPFCQKNFFFFTLFIDTIRYYVPKTCFDGDSLLFALDSSIASQEEQSKKVTFSV